MIGCAVSSDALSDTLGLMRFLAIDLGDKRTGTATGDDETGLVHPGRLLALPRGPALVEAISREWTHVGCDAIVIGLPLNMDGTEGPRAELTRSFGTQLGCELGVTVAYHDERLTSAAADSMLVSQGVTGRDRKARRDAMAAAAMLEDFLHLRRSSR